MTTGYNIKTGDKFEIEECDDCGAMCAVNTVWVGDSNRKPLTAASAQRLGAKVMEHTPSELYLVEDDGSCVCEDCFSNL